MEKKPYCEQLRELNLLSLVYRWKCGDMIQAYKLLSTNQENELLEIDPSHITQGHPKQICKLHARAGARCSFFSNRILNLWNNPKENTVSAESTDVFKRRLDAEWSDKPWRFEYICWFSRNSVLLEVVPEVHNLVWEEAASCSRPCIKFADSFWVSLCYVGGVNLQELIFLIGREEFVHLDHVPTFLSVD